MQSILPYTPYPQDTTVRFAVTFALAIEIEMVVSAVAPQMNGVVPSSAGSEAQVVLSATLEMSQNTVCPTVQVGWLDELAHMTSR